VKRGIENIKELGQVVQFKGEKKLTVWSGDQCNNFMGTDSTIFPPFLTPNDTLGAFTPEICRCVPTDRFVYCRELLQEQLRPVREGE
jgi:hypothetical protein